MPNATEIRSVITTYIEKMCASDIDGIMDLFSEDCTVEDPVGGEVLRGQESVRAFYGFAAPMLNVEVKGPLCVAGDHCACLLLARLSAPEGDRYLDATDVFAFNADGKIVSMKAYWNPQEMRDNA